jgi:hypothetical protein
MSTATLTTAAMAISIVLYLIVAVGNYVDKDYPHAGARFCYSLANAFFIWYELSKDRQ